MADKFKDGLIPFWQVKSEFYRKKGRCSENYFSCIRLLQNFRAAKKKANYQKKVVITSSIVSFLGLKLQKARCNAQRVCRPPTRDEPVWKAASGCEIPARSIYPR